MRSATGCSSRRRRSPKPRRSRRGADSDGGGSMELIGRILDGSIPQDLKEALRRAEPSGPRVSNDEKIRHLEDVPLLADCTQKQLRALSDISRVVEVPAGTSLTRAGQPGDEFFVIIDGSASLGKTREQQAVSR